MTGQCTRTVHWYDLGVTVPCVRPQDHRGLHRDGTRWFDDAGFQQPHEPAQPVYGRARTTRLNPEEVAEIRDRHAAGHTVAGIARALGIDYLTVYRCALRLTYRSVA